MPEASCTTLEPALFQVTHRARVLTLSDTRVVDASERRQTTLRSQARPGGAFLVGILAPLHDSECIRHRDPLQQQRHGSFSRLPWRCKIRCENRRRRDEGGRKASMALMRAMFRCLRPARLKKEIRASTCCSAIQCEILPLAEPLE
jgi:hypothetical protein